MLALLGLPTLISFAGSSHKGPRYSRSISFFVAGVRFHHTALVPVAGDRVILKPTTWRKQPCCEVWSTHGELLGYVPRQALNDILNSDSYNPWILQQVNRDTVPWKWYRVASGNTHDDPKLADL